VVLDNRLDYRLHSWLYRGGSVRPAGGGGMKLVKTTGELICDEEGTFIQIVVKWKANLSYAGLRSADLSFANLRSADLSFANLRSANLRYANLSFSNLSSANLSYAGLSYADLSFANLRSANLSSANLSFANLRSADLRSADLRSADLSSANLSSADLRSADLSSAKNLIKIMGVIPGNCYYKRFETGLNNQGYQYNVGLNILRNGEKFADDERVACTYPGFHFASKSWCAVNYSYRPLEALIRIPLNAKINEPWATDGKASADKIEILQVWEVKTGKDVTEDYK
jgi:hypothetical protein